MESKVTGSPDFNTDAPHFLIILMGSLGDVSRGLCIAHQLKVNYPKSKITWLVEPACKTIVSLNGYIDRIIVFERSKNIFAIPQLLRELKKEKFDVVFDMQRHFKSGLFSKLSGCKTRIGFAPANSKEFNYLFNNFYIENLPKDKPKLSHYLEFIKRLGREVVHPLDFGLTKVKENPQQQEVLKIMPRPYIAFVIGSSWESKDWPPAYYASLIDKVISETNYNAVLLGDKSQAAAAELIQNSVADKLRLCNMAGKTSLTDIVAIIDESKFCFGPDSGPGHIAGTLNKKYISLFGPTDPAVTAPYGNEDLVLQSSLGCMPCYKRTCPGLGKLCMHLITPDIAYKKVKGLAEAL